MKPQPVKKVVTTPTQTIKKPVTIIKNEPVKNILFTKENYKWMLIGLAVLAVGFFLMAGGKSSNPDVFKDQDIYSPVRITIAPILIVGGLLIEIFAIMKKPK